jgi:hypothetical protein
MPDAMHGQRSLLHNVFNDRVAKTISGRDAGDDGYAASQYQPTDFDIAILGGGHAAGQNILSIERHRASWLAFRDIG